MPSLCLPFRCCNVLVRTMPVLNCARPMQNLTLLCLRIALLVNARTLCCANALLTRRQCFARPFVAYAPIVAVAGDCSAVPTHCSSMPILRFGFRPCRASLRHCLAEHNFAIAALYRTSLCLGYAVHACAATELCFTHTLLCLYMALRSVTLLCFSIAKPV